ncbi:hypothetical protein ACQ1PF_07865 [Ornithobacterium rhinotracheale]
MNRIKNIHLVTDEKIKEELEHRAFFSQRFARVEFKIKSLTDDEIVIRVTQGKNPSGNFFDKKRLIEIVNENFSPYFPSHKIIAHATPYKEPKTEVVTPEWIQEKKKKHKLTLKQMCEDLGIAKGDVSANVSGLKPLSNRTKAMFYYYFKFLEK